MARQVKCPRCGEKLDKEEAIEYIKKYYHQECLDEWEMEKKAREELLTYICKIYRLNAPTGMILKQIKDQQEEFGYKITGIRLALEYFYETLGNRPQEGAGIGIVPYVYEDAKRHYIKQMGIMRSVQNEENHSTDEHVVYIQPNINKKIKKIDISSI